MSARRKRLAPVTQTWENDSPNCLHPSTVASRPLSERPSPPLEAVMPARRAAGRTARPAPPTACAAGHEGFELKPGTTMESSWSDQHQLPDPLNLKYRARPRAQDYSMPDGQPWFSETRSQGRRTLDLATREPVRNRRRQEDDRYERNLRVKITNLRDNSSFHN
jgi:hypothetical protein